MAPYRARAAGPGPLHPPRQHLNLPPWVAAYKYPRIVRCVDALPKGATGKILKREIVVGPLMAPPV
ncbi:hypothetical protein GCM10009837_42890 [Streptomyces durmitorensis]